MINRAEVMGRLTQAPELRYTPQGTAYCRLRVATNRVVNGEKQTEYHDVVAWQTLAETCGKVLRKGEVVHVEGRLQTESWEQDGRKLQRTRIVANRIHFLGEGHKSATTEHAEDPVETAGEESA